MERFTLILNPFNIFMNVAQNLSNQIEIKRLPC